MSFMTLAEKPSKEKKTVQPKVERENIWKHNLKKLNGSRKPGCRGFICGLFQFGPKRIRLLQIKTLKGESLDDKRGEHENHPKIPANVYSMVMDHLKSIPHEKAHYSYVKSNRLYFKIKTQI